MIDVQSKKVLVIAPHTDDAEFGCGATIAKLIEQKNEVYCVAFSACKQTVLPNFPPDILIQEIKSASTLLGIQPNNLILFDYEVRSFSTFRQQILDQMIALRDKIHPDLVLIPSTNDIHQDHQTIANEAIRAFKFSCIFAYEIVWNNLTFNTTCFSKLEERHVEAKVSALKEYKSQAHRTYSNPEFIRSLARVRGIQIGETFAECFDVIRYHF